MAARRQLQVTSGSFVGWRAAVAAGRAEQGLIEAAEAEAARGTLEAAVEAAHGAAAASIAAALLESTVLMSSGTSPSSDNALHSDRA